MAKGKRKGSAAVDRAAELVGHALGSVAGTIESLHTQHPHPMEEAREALAAGQETLTAAAAKAGTHAAAMIRSGQAVARQTKKVATAHRKSTPVVTRATRTARNTVKRARKAVRQGRKTVQAGRTAPEALIRSALHWYVAVHQRDSREHCVNAVLVALAIWPPWPACGGPRFPIRHAGFCLLTELRPVEARAEFAAWRGA